MHFLPRILVNVAMVCQQDMDLGGGGDFEKVRTLNKVDGCLFHVDDSVVVLGAERARLLVGERGNELQHAIEL